MAKTSTRNQAFLYVYNEMSLSEEVRFEAELLFSEALQEEVEQIQNLKKALDSVRPNASERAVQNVLAYSKAHRSLKLGNGSYSDLIIN